MVDEDLRVALAQLNGRLDALQQTVELRLDGALTTAQKAREAAQAGHQRLDTEGSQLRNEFRGEINDLREVVEDLRRWQSRLVGIGVGVSLMSGMVSGLLVRLLASA